MFHATTFAIAITAIAAMLTLSAEAGAATKTTPAPKAIAVSLDKGRPAFAAPGATLDQVLRAIAAEAGFRLAIKGDLAGPIHSPRMKGVPLVRALQRLVGNTSMVMILEPANDGNAARRLAELRIYAAAGRVTTEPRHEAPSPKPRRRSENREGRLN